MNILETAGAPTDEQLPNLAPATLHRLSTEIMTYDGPGDARDLAAPRRRWAPRLVLAAAAAAATVVISVAALPSPQARAAGWLARPTAAAGAARAALETDCQARMDSGADGVLVEARGRSNLTVLGDTSMCLNATGPGIPFELITGGRSLLPAADPAPDQVQVVQAGSLGSVSVARPGEGPGEAAPSGGYMGVIGRVGANVTGIVIHAADQPDITASIQNGWFAAWWPSIQDATSMTVTTAAGSHSQSLELSLHWDPVHGWTR